MKNNIIAYLKMLLKQFNESKRTKFLSFVLVSTLVITLVRSGSAERQVEANIRNNKITEEIQAFINSKDMIKKITVIHYGLTDRFYLELEGKNSIKSEYSNEESKRIKNEFIIPHNFALEEHKASYWERFVFYAVMPVVKTFQELSSGLLIIIMIVMFTLSILVMRGRMGEKKSKFRVENPQDIKSSIESLVGMEDVKAELKNIVAMYKNKDAYKAYGLDNKDNFNIMFSGPAGVGKTVLAGCLAQEFNCPIIIGSAAGLETGLVGGGSDTIKAIYNEAQKYQRCIIFLDEAEILFKKRGSNNPHGSKHNDDTANMALSLLEGISSNHDREIIWVVASNFNEVTNNMDEAMLRRFPIKLDFRLPNKNERKDIFKLYISKIETANLAEIDYEYLAEISTGLSPALIKTIVQRAGIEGATNGKKITTGLLYDAFEKTTIGLTNRETTANSQEKRKLIGVHELGHFMVEFDELFNKYNKDWKSIKENMKVLKISTESVAKQGALGYVISKQEEVGLHTLNDLENHVKQLYGGVVAEKVFFGERSITVGSGNDIEKATNILRHMIFSLGMYSKSKINYQIINNSAKNDDLTKFLEQKSEELFNETETIIHKYKDLISHLNPILMERYVLQADEILAEIESFYKLENN